MRKILLLSFLILASCGARKTTIDKVDVVVKTDSTSTTKKEVVSTQDNHISIVTDTDELEIVPIDTTKSITVDGKKYHNVKLRYKKTKKVLVDSTKIKVSEKSLIKVSLKKDARVKTFKKEADKKSSCSMFLWLFLILLLIALGYYAYKRSN